MSGSLVNFARSAPYAAPSAALSIEIVGDLACPFCFLGKRRLDKALDAVKGPTAINWYPWQLNRDLPTDGVELNDYLSRRFGSSLAVKPILENLRVEGAEDGIDFRFDRIRRMPNTLRAHQLLYLAEQQEKDSVALADSLMSAFFETGKDIGDIEVLVAAADRFDITSSDVIAITDDAQTRDAVLACERQVRESGISGVPGFLLNRRLLIVGAQEVDGMINAFDRAMFGEGNDDVVSPALN